MMTLQILVLENYLIMLNVAKVVTGFAIDYMCLDNIIRLVSVTNN